MAKKPKEPTLEDSLMTFLEKHHGDIMVHIPGDAVAVMLEIAGSPRTCKFEYAGNPIRARILVDAPPQHPEHVQAFQSLLEEMDPHGDFSHRISIDDTAVFNVFDLLVPTGAFDELMELWLANAHIEVSRIDLMLRSAQGVVGERGEKYEFPIPSYRRN